MSTEQNNNEEVVETQVQEPQEDTFVAEPLDWYEFDWDKVNTIDDIKTVLSAMGMKFNRLAPNFDNLKEFAKKVD